MSEELTIRALTRFIELQDSGEHGDLGLSVRDGRGS
jgi:hypothetical protein